jgi:DHA2 family multidrug resistance protein
VHQHGLPWLQAELQGQATVMTYSDLYWVFGVAMLFMIPLVLLLKPLSSDKGGALGA